MLNSSNAISHLILTAILDLVITVIPFLQWEEPRSERLRNSPKVTQLKRLGVRIPRMYPLDVWGFPGKESACQCRRHKTQEFAPWVKKIPWRRKWQPSPVSLPGKSHGQRSLVGYSPCGCRESHTPERLTLFIFMQDHYWRLTCLVSPIERVKEIWFNPNGYRNDGSHIRFNSQRAPRS